MTISKDSEQPGLEKTFFQLAEKWENETRFCSSPNDIRMNESYQQIIGLGPNVLPFLLDDLRNNLENPPFWFAALRAISRDDPVPPDHRGYTVKSAVAWIQWGLKRGLIDEE